MAHDALAQTCQPLNMPDFEIDQGREIKPDGGEPGTMATVRFPVKAEA